MLTVLVLLMAVQVFAQKSTITGVVKNIDGMPIVGAAVQEKGLTNSTITDPEGKFSLQVYDGKALIVKMKGYYTQVIKLEEGTVNLDNIVLVKVERWEFGLSAGFSVATEKKFHALNASIDWAYKQEDIFYVGRYHLGYENSRCDLNVGAYLFFNPYKRNIRIKTLIGLGLSLFSKKLNTYGIVYSSINYFGHDAYDLKESGDFLRWKWDFSLKQVVNTLDLQFLIKHKIRVRESGICLMYGPLCGVALGKALNLKFGKFAELYKGEYEGEDEWVTYNDVSESKCGITYEKAKKKFKKDFGNKFVLGGLGALGFEHSSGVGIWGTFTTKCYRNQYGWNLRVPSVGGALTYKF